MAAIAAGGDIPALVQALQARERKRKALDAQLAKPSVLPERDVLRAALQLRERQWRDVLRGPHIQQARRVLQRLIDLPIQIRRDLNKPPKWVTQARPGGLLVGLIRSVASPRQLNRLYFEGPLAA